MAKNSIGDFIRSVFSSAVNRDGVIFKALLADKNTNDGTIERIFEQFDEERKDWTDKKSIYEMYGEQFVKTKDLINVLDIPKDNTEAVFKRLFELLFIHKDITPWGTRYFILDVVKRLFSLQSVYIANDMTEENIIENPYFEQESDWILNNAFYSSKSAFEGLSGLAFENDGSISQIVKIEKNTLYVLHFAFCADVKIRIFDSSESIIKTTLNDKGEIILEFEGEIYADYYLNEKGEFIIQSPEDFCDYFLNEKGDLLKKNRYWFPNKNEIGEWSSEKVKQRFFSEDWKLKSIPIQTDEKSLSIKISFFGNENSKLDFVRMNKMENQPGFSILVKNRNTVHDYTGYYDYQDGESSNGFNDSYFWGTAGLASENLIDILLDALCPAGIFHRLEKIEDAHYWEA